MSTAFMGNMELSKLFSVQPKPHVHRIRQYTFTYLNKGIFDIHIIYILHTYTCPELIPDKDFKKLKEK